MKRNITWTRRSRDPSSTPLNAPQNGEKPKREIQKMRKWTRKLGTIRSTLPPSLWKEEDDSGRRGYEKRRRRTKDLQGKARRIIKIEMKHYKLLTIVFNLSKSLFCVVYATAVSPYRTSSRHHYFFVSFHWRNYGLTMPDKFKLQLSSLITKDNTR